MILYCKACIQASFYRRDNVATAITIARGIENWRAAVTVAPAATAVGIWQQPPAALYEFEHDWQLLDQPMQLPWSRDACNSVLPVHIIWIANSSKSLVSTLQGKY